MTAKRRPDQYRNKIKSRHVDFVVFDPLSGQIDYAIELDDQTHNTPSGYKDDQLKIVAFSKCRNPAGTDEGKKKLQLSWNRSGFE